MILSDLLTSDVVDSRGALMGRVSDIRFRQDANSLPADMVLHGLIVSPHTASSFLGYDRQDVRSPWLIARLLTWRQRGSFLVLWSDLQRIDRSQGHGLTVRLRPDFTPHEPRLPAD